MKKFLFGNFTSHTLSFKEVRCRNDSVKISGHSIKRKWSPTNLFVFPNVKHHVWLSIWKPLVICSLCSILNLLNNVLLILNLLNLWDQVHWNRLVSDNRKDSAVCILLISLLKVVHSTTNYPLFHRNFQVWSKHQHQQLEPWYDFAAAAVSIRFTMKIWLIGQPLSSMEEPRQLPVSGVTLRCIYYKMKCNKTTLAAACSTIADEEMLFWIRANISMIANPHGVAKLKSLHQEHVTVSKPRQWQSLKADFTKKLNQLFDIADAKWERRTMIH